MQTTSRLNVFARVILTFILIGACFGAFTMYAAWDHNPQGEFHDETGVHWLDWLRVGFSWFVAVAGLPCLIATIFRILFSPRNRDNTSLI